MPAEHHYFSVIQTQHLFKGDSVYYLNEWLCVTGCARPVISKTKEDTSAATLKHNLSGAVCVGSQTLLRGFHKVEPHPQRIWSAVLWAVNITKLHRLVGKQAWFSVLAVLFADSVTWLHGFQVTELKLPSYENKNGITPPEGLGLHHRGHFAKYFALLKG